jgi:signal peptidase II
VEPTATTRSRLASLAVAHWPWLAVSVLLADQATKRLVEHELEPGAMRSIIPGLFNLVHTENRGVAFGILADTRALWLVWFLVGFSLTAMLLLIWLLNRDRVASLRGRLGAALILGGAAGNVLDRLLRQSVVDFLDFHLGRYHWPAFNVADLAIVVGGGLLLLALVTERAGEFETEE